MKRGADVLTAILLLLLLSAPVLGKELKPDRVISVTSMEHLNDKTGKAYRVNAKAWENGKPSGSEPTSYYQLLCGTGAAYLEVGHLYKAMEAYEKGSKILVILDVNPAHDPTDLGIICDVELVKSLDNPKR